MRFPFITTGGASRPFQAGLVFCALVIALCEVGCGDGSSDEDVSSRDDEATRGCTPTKTCESKGAECGRIWNGCKYVKCGDNGKCERGQCNKETKKCETKSTDSTEKSTDSTDSNEGEGRTLFLNFDAVTLYANSPSKPIDATKSVAWFKWEDCKNMESVSLPALTKTCTTDAECPGGTCSLSYEGSDGVKFRRCNVRDRQYEADILERVQYTLAPFNARAVSQRPSSGRYDMVVFTLNLKCLTGDGGGGSAVQGCGQSSTNEVFYAHQNRQWTWNTGFLAKAVLHEWGHTFGLFHYEVSGDPPVPIDPMGSDRGDEPLRFINSCLRTGPMNDGVACSLNKEICGGRPFMQNSHQLLLRVLGPAPRGGVRH